MLSHVVGIVAGGASGLGAAATTSLISRGARVIVADLPHQKDAFSRVAAVACAEAAKHTDSTDPVLSFAEVDVTDQDQISTALDMAETCFGEPGAFRVLFVLCAVIGGSCENSPTDKTILVVNVAINCAGIAVAKKTLSKKKGISDIVAHSLEDFSKTLNINTVGTFNVSRLAAERMATREPEGSDGLRGCIINTASVAAFDGQKGQVAYSASKGAIVGMTLPMARDLASFGIRVMTIVRLWWYEVGESLYFCDY